MDEYPGRRPSLKPLLITGGIILLLPFLLWIIIKKPHLIIIALVIIGILVIPALAKKIGL